METGADGEGGVLAEARALVRKLGPLQKKLWRDLDSLLGSEPADEPAGEPAGEPTSEGVPLVCLARLLVGSCCEAQAALRAARICKPGSICQASKQELPLARLYRDALLAAAWTSAHATYLNDLIAFSIAPSSPSIHSVPSELCEFDLTGLFARRVGDRTLSKDAAHVAALLGRCTAAGTRGWDTVLRNAMDKSEGARRLCSNALTVGMLGMTASVHPAERLRWPQRLELAGILVTRLTVAELPAMATSCVVELKEAFRRVVSASVAPAYAERAALLRLHSPSALMQPHLLGMPSSGLQSASRAFARAGVAVAAGDSAAVAIQRAFAEQAESSEMPFSANHIGKVCASNGTKQSAASVCAELWSYAFRTNFLPFWCHASANNVRASRLDSVQHEALHSTNAATKLVLLLGEREQLRLQRAALRCPSAGILTATLAGEVGGFAVPPPEQAATTKSVLEAARALGAAGAANAARMLAFSRAAHLSEQVMVYDLGPKTRQMQVHALARRLIVNEDLELPDSLSLEDIIDCVPEHARSLCACLECRRVCNAVACDAGTRFQHAFDELGTCASMIDTCSETRRVTLRCARRSSASLRAAVANEEATAERCVECDQVDSAVTRRLVVCSGGGGDNGVAARVRRDAKTASEQRVASVPCGAEAALRVPLVGKAVRVFGEWHALCSFCGCIVRFHSTNRVIDQIACLRCDARMLNRNEKRADRGPAPLPVCRFCGKQDTARSGAKWRLVRAPTDTSGENAHLPPPLRTVYFCLAHFRQWIPACAKTMAMRIILSHIVYGVKPVFGAAPEDKQDDLARPAKKQRKLGRRRAGGAR